jgi:hypothetical protein
MERQAVRMAFVTVLVVVRMVFVTVISVGLFFGLRCGLESFC